MKEPSVLDYLKSRLNPWQSEKVELAESEIPPMSSDAIPPVDGDETPKTRISFQMPKSIPWRTLLALALALFGQFTLDPTGFSFGADTSASLRETDFHSALMMGLIFYGIAVALLLWAYFAHEFSLPSLPEDVEPDTDPQTTRLYFLIAAGVLLLAAFLAFEKNLFSVLNVTLWLVGLALYLRGLWLHEKRQSALLTDGEQAPLEAPKPPFTLGRLINRWWDVGVLLLLALFGANGLGGNIYLFGLLPLSIAMLIVWLRDPNAILSPAQHIKAFFSNESWQVNFTRWTILIIAVSAVIIFFRFYRLDGVPIEPFSDHAEKLLDVSDLLQGKTHIFFERNTGREFIQFYWTALMAFLFNTGLTFISLKIGTVLIGLLTLPYIYLLGKELGGPRVALFALILAGVAYWPNTISRIGLRFPLYPAFVAPTLYYLIKGLRTQKRNQFILAGIFLGLGLHGYSPFRFEPFVVIAAVALYLLHKQAVGRRKQVLILFGILVLTSFLVFLPLFRYALEHPGMFAERSLTRLTDQEHPLPIQEWCPVAGNTATAACIFASNTFKAMMMFFWDNGSIWVHSVPGRPALDIAAAVLFAFGYIFLLVRYIIKRRWQDIFLLVAVPLLLMPSILSLAFPDENPSLNRTGGALVVVFVIAAIALDGVYTALRGVDSGRLRRVLAVSGVAIILCMSAAQSYDLVLNKFDTQFRAGAWNTSDIGKVMRAFMAEGNSPDNAWVVPFPYWVDTRLAGIQAGLPNKDFALDRDKLPDTLKVQGSKLFIFKDEDKDTMDLLRRIYPGGLVHLFKSPLQGKDFWIFVAPDSQVTP
jgi:hypothetical protein